MKLEMDLHVREKVAASPGPPPPASLKTSEVRLTGPAGAEERETLMWYPGQWRASGVGGKKVFASLNRNRDGVGLFHWWG